MRFNYHFYFLSYHQRNAMIVHRAGKKILMKEMAEGHQQFTTYVSLLVS